MWIDEASITRVFDLEQYEVYVQPKYNIETGQMVGGEALAGWVHDQEGGGDSNLSIQELEKIGRIGELDLFVFERVCHTLQKWHHQGIQCLPMAVNISQMTLDTPGFVERIRELVKKYSIEAKWIELEITETLICKNSEIVDTLKDEGFKIVMDKFGTGYSSLAILKQLALDVVKVDRAFLVGVEECTKSRAIFEMIIKLLAILEKEVIVEGVETLQQVEVIKSMGARFIQGYLYDKPLPIDVLTSRLAVSVYS